MAAATKVADIVVGANDSAGVAIKVVYGKVSEVYAVYGTEQRVVVQFADDDNLGADQRTALAPLNPIRGEINGLIDGWRQHSDDGQRAKGRLFDRRVADALVVGLQGDLDHALELLTAIKADVVAERTSVARTDYVLFAAASAVAVIVIVFITSPYFSRAFDRLLLSGAGELWLGGGMGATGAWFSIAVGIRSRSILTDLQTRDNRVDAALRILIGAISGAILVALLRSGFVQLSIGGTDIAKAMYGVMLVGFIAGFSERLVSDFLSQVAISAAKANPLAGNTPPPPAAGQPSNANERNPLGKPPPAPPQQSVAPAPALLPSGDDHIDGCASTLNLPAEQHTHDAELPEASGGVAKQ